MVGRGKRRQVCTNSKEISTVAHGGGGRGEGYRC